MSASDKKKLRKASEAEQLTQRQLREEKEAAAAKRKKTIYGVIGVVCAIAAVALLMWNHKGALDQGAVAAIVDGVDYRVPDVQFYYNQAKNYTYSLYQQYSAYGIDLGYDPNVADGAQWFNEQEGITYADYFRDTALNQLKETAALCAAAKAEGYTLSEEGEKAIKDNLSQIDLTCLQYGMTRASYFNQVFGNGVTEAVFVRNLRNDQLASEYANYHQENISYAEPSLKEYYEAHPDELDSYDFRSFFIDGTVADPTDAEGKPLLDAEGKAITATDSEKEAAMNAAKSKAAAAVAEIQAADDREKAFIATAPNYVAENYRAAYEDNENYSLVSGVIGNLLTQNNSVIAGWIMDSDRKSGDVTYIESASNGYYVLLFLKRELVDTPTVNVRHILLQPEVADDAATNSVGTKIPTDEAMAAKKAEAEALITEWKAGEATAESFGVLANEHSSDSGSNTNGGLYTHVYKGQMVPNFDAWCFDPTRKPGDVGLVENSGDEARYYGWHIIHFDSMEEPQWKVLATEAKQSTDQSTWLNDLLSKTEASAADGMSKVGAPNTAIPTATATPAATPEA